MMTTLLSIVAAITLNTGNLNEEDSLKEAKLITEIIENIESKQFAEIDLNFEKVISIYTPEGELLHEFTEANYDAKALRNADLLIQDTSSKIFIKYRN